MSESPESCVIQARNEVRQVCEWLLQPTAQTMEVCAPALERAVAYVQALSAGRTSTTPQLFRELQALANEIHSTQALLSAAGALYFGRMGRLATGDPGDTSSTPPPPSPPISVTG